VLIPVFIFLGGWTGSLLHESLARVNGKVRLAEELLYPAKRLQSPETKELIAFKASGKPAQELYVEATEILNRFYTGGWILGGFIGLAIGAFLLGKLFSRHRTDYEPNRGACFSCARCIDYCPVQS
jgi:NAD-dependent dihydropyrimidine dehydrogenase PreA subunit